MTNRLSHLEVKHERSYDWQNNLLKKSMPARAFTNILTGNLLLSIERMIVSTIQEIAQIKQYFKL